MAADPAGFALTVSAGATERKDCIVEFALPEGLKSAPVALTDASGKRLPLQATADGKACFILPALEANRSLTLEAVAGADLPQTVKAEAAEGRVAFTVQGKPVLTYRHAKTPLPEGYDPAFQRGGYIFPVFAPSGRLVVDDYPPNHKHHHGLWAAWTKTSFDGRTPDFWNMGGKTGTVEPVAMEASWSGPVHGGFRARHAYLDLTALPQPLKVLDETWEGRVYSLGASDAKYRVLDLEIRQTCATDRPLKLPKYHYGGIGVRGHRAWDGQGNMTALTSEGRLRETANGTSGRWCHLGGRVDGEPAGIAVLCHPSNFRAPQPMRVHPTEPFFCYAPSQGGDWEIKPGETHTMRYRFIVADGPADQTELDRLWNDYADPPKVEVEIR